MTVMWATGVSAEGRRRGWPWPLSRWLLGVVMSIRIALVSSMLRNSSRRDPRD